MELQELCLSCFQIKGEFDVCPYCGYVSGTEPEQAYHLQPGKILAGRYIVGIVLGFGGFGVTYKAWDSKLSTIVAVKEFYPNGLVSRVPGETKIVVFSGEKKEHFSSSLERFLEEARNMAKFDNDLHIVNVFDFFEANNTAYIVMEFLDGVSLKDYLFICGGKLDPDSALDIMGPVLDALHHIHAQGIIHRDISPDNIFITVDNEIKLLDFGAARFSTGDDEKTLSVVIKVGYAAPEQYRSKSKQGNYTDVYALGATLYHLITGIKPEESVDRQIEDTLKRPSELELIIDGNLEKSIMKAMAIKPELRFQRVSEFKDAIYNDRTVDFPEVEIKKRKKKRLITLSFISAGFLALCIAVGAYFTVIKPQIRLSADDMTADTITVWVPTSDNGGIEVEQNSVYHALADEFMDDNSEFQIEIVAIPESEYAGKIEGAASNQTLPTIFCSDTVDDNLVSGMAPLNKLVSSLNQNDYILMDRYEVAYPDMKKIPLGFLPVVTYVNSTVERELNSSDGIMQVVQNNGGKYSFYFGHSRYVDIIRLNDKSLITGDRLIVSQKAIDAIIDIKHAYNAQGFDFSGSGLSMLSSDKLQYLVEDTSVFRNVQAVLPGNYQVKPFDVNGSMAGYFTNEWSIGANATDNQKQIAMLFLSYLLSDPAQNVLFVQNDDAVPLNKQTFEMFAGVVNKDEFGFLKDNLNKFEMIGQHRNVLTNLNEYIIDNIILKDVSDSEIKSIMESLPTIII